MTSLKQQFEIFLRDWRNDLSPNWQLFFKNVEPDLNNFPSEFIYDAAFPIIPGRRAFPNIGAPADAHVFRAFDGIRSDEVKVVVIGQDPYPKVSRATGRAFEDGALEDWTGQVAVSLQRLMQSGLALRLDRPELARDPGGWGVIQSEVKRGQIELESPRAYFDARQTTDHVLYVNAGWTLTRFSSGAGSEQRAHIQLWQPMMTRLLRGIAARPSRSIVFLLLGGFAQRLFNNSGVEAAARSEGTWGASVRSVAHPHPNTQGNAGYLARGNPLLAVNSALTEMGQPGIAW